MRSVGRKKLVRKMEPPSEHRIRWPKWTGFHQKTVWDWLQLLVVPFMLAAFGLFFTIQQEERQRQVENDRAKAERELAVQRARDEALQGYLDQMNNLLLEHKLRDSKEDSEVRTLARARTVAVIQRLDSERNQTVIQFLGEADLIGNGESSISLIDRVDLHDARLESVNLSGANLSGANLEDADLSGADLEDADLSGADLEGANLSDAWMKGVSLICIKYPDCADLRGADLRGAFLIGANLEDARLIGANLEDANLSGANLKHARLEDANLEDAKLENADLVAAYLSGANLEDAHLTDANLTCIEYDFTDSDICADLSRANLENAELEDADLSEANLEDADLSRANLIAADLSRANLEDADLNGANMFATDLSGATGWLIEQLAKAKSLKAAIMPDGQRIKSAYYSDKPTFEEWLKSRENGKND